MTEQTGKKMARGKKYLAEDRNAALVLAEKIGVPAAAVELELSKSMLYRWRSAAQQNAEQEAAQAGEIAALQQQLAELEEELAILKKAEAYFA